MKKIVTVSVLAIMAVSAANADIASTTYVDKTAAGAVTSGLAVGGNIDTAIKTATTDMATQTWVTDTATAAKAKADASGNVITETYATKEALQGVVDGNLTLKPGSITTTEIKDGTITIDDFGQDLTSDVEVWDNTTDMVMDWHTGDTSVPKATADASGNVITETYATKQALTDGLSGKVDNATLNSYYTKTEADAEFIDGDELAAATVANAGHATTADSATQATQDGNGKVIADTYATKVEAAGYVDPNELNTALKDYSTTIQMNTELDKKQDKATAVTHTEKTAVGDTTHAVYIDSTGAAKVVEKVAAAEAADTATDAANYTADGTIAADFAKVAAFGTIPTVPATCAEKNANGELTRDCTLVMKYNASTNAVTPEWEVIAR